VAVIVVPDLAGRAAVVLGQNIRPMTGTTGLVLFFIELYWVHLG
jgi:hypothetical protein